jgi:hypothetical protein
VDSAQYLVRLDIPGDADIGNRVRDWRTDTLSLQFENGQEKAKAWTSMKSKFIAAVCVLAASIATARACPPGYYERCTLGKCVCLPGGSGAPNPGPPMHHAMSRELVPVRAFMRSSEIPPKSIGAYGVFALRGKPTSASRARLLMACHSYVSYLPRDNAVPAKIPQSDRMLTIWPLDNPSAPQALHDDCDYAIDHYDLYGADSAIHDAQLQGAVFGERGPFLIGWSPSNTRGKSDQLVLVVDMSLFDSQQSFDSAFIFWKQKVIENPELWRTGFSSEKLRLALRDFVDEYGQDFLSAVKLWKQ